MEHVRADHDRFPLGKDCHKHEHSQIAFNRDGDAA
jgi:hypothetical protein